MASKNINPKKVDGSALPTSNSGLGSDDLWQDNGSVRVGTSTPTSFLNISNANLTSNGSYGLDLNGNTLVLGGTTTASTETISIQKNTLIKTEDTLISSRGFKVINSAGLDMLDIRNNGQIGYGGSYNATVGHFFKNPTNAGTVAGFRHQDGSAILNVSNTNRNLHLYSHTNQDSLIAGQWGNDSRLDFYHKGTQLIRLNNGTLNYFNIPSMIFGGNVYIGTEDFSIQGDTLVKGSNNSESSSGFKATDINDNSLLDVRNNGQIGYGGAYSSSFAHIFRNPAGEYNIAEFHGSNGVANVKFESGPTFILQTSSSIIINRVTVASGVTKLQSYNTSGVQFLNLESGDNGFYSKKLNLNAATAAHDHAVIQLNQSGTNVSSQLFFANITTTTLGRNGSISGWGTTEKGFECFDTTTNKKHVWNGTAWEQILSNTTGVISSLNISNADLTFNATYNADLNGNDWSIKDGSNTLFSVNNDGSFIIGKGATNNNVLSKNQNVLIGTNATIGFGVQGWCEKAIAIGYNASATETSSIAIGGTSNYGSVAIGVGSDSGGSSVAIGIRASSPNDFSIAIGSEASSSNTGAISIGKDATSSALYATSLGYTATVTAQLGVSLGWQAKSAAYMGLALGPATEANHSGSVVLGTGFSVGVNSLKSTATNQLTVGFNSGTPTMVIGATSDSYIKSTGNLSLETNTTVKGSDNSASTTGFKVTDINDDSLLEVKNTGEVVIGTTSSNDSAKLQVDSTTQGFAGPRMTTTERNNISTPIAGLEVYDTTLNSKMIYNGTSWDSLLPTSGGSGTKVLVKGAMGANQTATSAIPIVEFVTTGTPAGGSLNVNSEWNNTTHRFTVGSSGAGTYLIQSQLFLNNGTGWSTLYLYKNGSIYSSFGGNGTDTTNTWDNLDGTIPIDLVVGDYIDIRVYSSSNGTINFNDWASRQAFSITKVSAVAPAAGTDVNALHTNISNEINSLTEKTDPSNTDSILIEESDGTKKSQSRKNFKRPIVSTTTTLSSLTPLVDDIEAYVLTSLSSNITINAPTGTPYDFQNLWFRITDNGTSRTITKNAIFVDYTGNFPTSTTINKQLIFASQWDGSNWNILAWKIQP